MFSRYMEAKNSTRIEVVKFPSIYNDRSTQQRKDEESDLLEQFQKKLSLYQ